jgi:hypothetical protein
MELNVPLGDVYLNVFLHVERRKCVRLKINCHLITLRLRRADYPTISAPAHLSHHMEQTYNTSCSGPWLHRRHGHSYGTYQCNS